MDPSLNGPLCPLPPAPSTGSNIASRTRVRRPHRRAREQQLLDETEPLVSPGTAVEQRYSLTFNAEVLFFPPPWGKRHGDVPGLGTMPTISYGESVEGEDAATLSHSVRRRTSPLRPARSTPSILV